MLIVGSLTGWSKHPRADLDRLRQRRLTWAQYSLLQVVRQLVDPKTGSVRTTALDLHQVVKDLCVKTVLMALAGLKAARLIWYPGESSGQHEYLLLVEGYELSGGGRVSCYGEKGEIVGSALEEAKILGLAGGPVSTSRKASPPSSAAPGTAHGGGHAAGVPVDTPAAEPPDGKGSGRGSRRGKALTVPGLSPTDGGHFRRVHGGVDGGVENARIENVRMREGNTPPRAPASPAPETDPPSASASGKDQKLADVARELCLEFYRLQREALPHVHAHIVRPCDLKALSQLVRQNGRDKVAEAIAFCIKDEFLLGLVTRPNDVWRKWSKIQADLSRKAKNAVKKRRSTDSSDSAAPGEPRKRWTNDPFAGSPGHVPPGEAAPDPKLGAGNP